MALLWENFVQQLNSVRSSTSVATSASLASSAAAQPTSDAMDEPSDRRRRLQTALDAIKDSGNAMMIESLTAAIEGREANLSLPELPDGIAKF